MDQLIANQPVFTWEPVVPEPVKKFPKWPFIVLFAFILGIASVFAYQKLWPTRSLLVGSSPSPQVSPALSPSPDLVAGWQTYQSPFWNVELRYPSEISFTNKKVFDQETLRFENDNSYMQIENTCTIGIQENQEDTVSLLGSVFPRYKLLKSGDYNQLHFNTGELTVNDKRCMDIVFGLKPDFEKDGKLLFDFILSTFKFLDKTCQYNGKTYQDGEEIPDKCNFCSCEAGQIACTLKACED